MFDVNGGSAYSGVKARNGDRSGVLLVCFVCCWLGGVRIAEQFAARGPAPQAQKSYLQS
uniref:Uncharacterized protein n=1 Tax=Brassica campestris TaxID=3711 RepID=M4DUU5_BRACM